jgi:glutathione S-transferase
MVALSCLSLYPTRSCPYCERVRVHLRRLDLGLEIRDINSSSALRMELIEATGRQTVPCLRIDHDDGRSEWMHESADIIEYLEQHFG